MLLAHLTEFEIPVTLIAFLAGIAVGGFAVRSGAWRRIK